MGETTASDPISAAVAPGYAFEGPALELGGLMTDAETLTGVPIRIPLGMLNRHGLVAGWSVRPWNVVVGTLSEALA